MTLIWAPKTRNFRKIWVREGRRLCSAGTGMMKASYHTVERQARAPHTCQQFPLESSSGSDPSRSRLVKDSQEEKGFNTSCFPAHEVSGVLNKGVGGRNMIRPGSLDFMGAEEGRISGEKKFLLKNMYQFLHFK